ncbi:mesothelin-like protein [Myotis yumanensis]|uniref:mesothelin-like protein n=1 Tax=Myotis yumanensis TaxID=159337 RepID=UPI0038D01572
MASEVSMLDRPALDLPRPLVSRGLILCMWLTTHCAGPHAEGFSQEGLDASRADLWASANTSLLQGFRCQPASQLSRDRLSALIRRMASQQVLLKAWQVRSPGWHEWTGVSRARTGSQEKGPGEGIYPSGIPEEQLRLITSLVYLYSLVEIHQWNITSRDTVMALLASDVALENQTEAILQKFLDHKGTITSALLVAIGGSRLCWMSPRQIQAIRPSEFRLAGALDTSSCPQSRKNELFFKAREAFGSTRTTAAYYDFVRPYLGGAPTEELQRLAQANVSMDIHTFTNLNPCALQNLSVNNVRTLLGQNVGDLQKARSHPTISSWLRSLNKSLDELGLDTDPASPTSPTRTHSNTPWISHLTPPGEGPGKDAPTSGSPSAHLGYLPLAVALPSSLLWLLYWGALGPCWDSQCPLKTGLCW